ncbi:MAG: ATP-binding cassette domain-containing protein [Candidatus Paceibacterota bacterium]
MNEKLGGQAILEIKNLTKKYGTKTAVDNISLSIPKGTFYGLLGPNGAGKSTTIHCITGIAQPTSGQILVDGIDVVKDYKQARTKVGLSPRNLTWTFLLPPSSWLTIWVATTASRRRCVKGELMSSLLVLT